MPFSRLSIMFGGHIQSRWEPVYVGTLDINRMLRALIISNHGVRLPAFFWCACHVFVRYVCQLCVRWLLYSSLRCTCMYTCHPSYAGWTYQFQSLDALAGFLVVCWPLFRQVCLSTLLQVGFLIHLKVCLSLLAVSMSECVSQCFVPAHPVCWLFAVQLLLIPVRSFPSRWKSLLRRQLISYGVLRSHINLSSGLIQSWFGSWFLQ